MKDFARGFALELRHKIIAKWTILANSQLSKVQGEGRRGEGAVTGKRKTKHY